MAIAGERKSKHLAEGYETHSMYPYAAAVCETMTNIRHENHVDVFKDARDMILSDGANATMRNFFVENSCDPAGMTAAQLEDHRITMENQYENDVEAIRENVGTAEMNPVVGMTFPMHKNILMNMVFDKGSMQKVVAIGPSIPLTMETRILVDTEGNEIDMFLEQNKMTAAIDKTSGERDFEIDLPLKDDTELVHTYLGGLAGADELSRGTYVSAVLVKDVYYEVGDILPNPDTGYVERNGERATTAGAHDTWYKVQLPFTPGYQGFERSLMQPIKIAHKTLDGTDVKVTEFKDMLSGSMEKSRINLMSLNGNVTKVRIHSKLDTSNHRQTTCSVKWKQKTDLIEIDEAIPINTTISPMEVKDISALYNINQLTKIMELIKTVLANYKDDKILEFLDNSFDRLDARSSNYTNFDFAPRVGYSGDHIQHRKDTFMEHLDRHVTILSQALNDPSMTVTIFGNPDIVSRLTPNEYTYQSPASIGPMELDYQKTVVNSTMKRVYNFISSDKMRNRDELIVIMTPTGNSNRITYRIYDYQMYIANEIRNSNNPALPAITAFERWKPVEYQPVQGRINILNPSGITEDYNAFPVRVLD